MLKGTQEVPLASLNEGLSKAKFKDLMKLKKL